MKRYNLKASELKKNQQQVDDIKIPPHSLEAEQSVLGGLMLDNERWDSVSTKVNGNDFYSSAHRYIFVSIEKLLESGKPLDLITLSQNLAQQNKLEAVGGFAYLAELAKNTPSAANITAYAEIVRERAIIREMITAAHAIADDCYNPQGRNSEILLDLAESRVFNIAEHRTKDIGLKNIHEIMEETLATIEHVYQNPSDGVTGLATGFTDLDKKTCGLQKSDLIVVAARPAMGKTTFALNLCEHAALTQDKPVLVFSLEMPANQLMIRILASLSRVDQTSIRTGQLNDEDWARLMSTMGLMMEKRNMYIDDSSGLTPTELSCRARRIFREHGGLSLIMIDYLQLMRAPSYAENRTLEIAEISRSLKALAKELTVPVVAISQLNRGLEQRADKRPINSDLRESGSIEQDADVILFIYRDEVYNENSDKKGIAEVILGKQRNGPIGSVRLAFNGKCSRFDNYTNVQYEGKWKN